MPLTITTKLKDNSEDFTYTFKDGSQLTVTIQQQQKTHTFVDKDWTPDQEPELKHWEANVYTKSFVIPDWTDKVFRKLSSAKKFIKEECEKNDK